MYPPAQRTGRLPGNFFVNLDDRIRDLRAQGRDVIRLDVGSPDLPPATHIVAALASAAAEPGNHGYQPHHGTAPLRRAWAHAYQRRHGLELDPDTEIYPLLGSKEGIFHLAMALLDPGDLVLAPDPGYITYTSGARFAGAQVHPLPLRPETGYLPDLDEIPPKVRRKAKILWLNYPNNPTGAVAGMEFFQRAVRFCQENRVLLCHDAAYTQVTFDRYRAPSILEVPGARQTAVEFNSLSKSHNMAGWRVGVAVGNRQALEPLYRLKTNADSSHFLPIMQAAQAALMGDQSWLAGRNRIYQTRRDLLVGALRELGLAADCPKASLYVWARIPDGWTSETFAAALLEQAHVSLTPGSFFGPHGEGFVRLTLTAPQTRIRQAIDRLAGAACLRPR